MTRAQIGLGLFLIGGIVWALAPSDPRTGFPPAAAFVLVAAAIWAGMRFRRRRR